LSRNEVGKSTSISDSRSNTEEIWVLLTVFFLKFGFNSKNLRSVKKKTNGSEWKRGKKEKGKRKKKKKKQKIR